MKNYSSARGSVLMRDVFLNLRRELLKNPHYQLVPSEVRAPSFFFCVCIVSVKRRFFLENNRRYFFILLRRVFFIGNLPGWGSKSAVYFRSCFVSKIGKFCKTRNDDGRIRHGNQLKDFDQKPTGLVIVILLLQNGQFSSKFRISSDDRGCR